MEEIQNELKLELQWRGAPQPTETIKSAASLCAEELQTGVDPSVYSYFLEAAKALMESMGAEKALCAALAKISGIVSCRVVLYCIVDDGSLASDASVYRLDITIHLNVYSHIFNSFRTH